MMSTHPRSMLIACSSWPSAKRRRPCANRSAVTSHSCATCPAVVTAARIRSISKPLPSTMIHSLSDSICTVSTPGTLEIFGLNGVEVVMAYRPRHGEPKLGSSR
jgi:hypothetical protein